MLLPENLTERYGKIDFNTIQFFTEDDELFIPKGGGSSKFINVKHIYKDKDIFREFEADALFPDPWIIKHQHIYVKFKLMES